MVRGDGPVNGVHCVTGISPRLREIGVLHILPYISCFPIYLTIMMLVKVKLDMRGYQRNTFQGCIFHWSSSFLIVQPKRSWQHSGGANEKTASLHTCALFSPKDGKCLPNLFSLRTLENSFLHLLLVGKHSNVAYTSDNVTRHLYVSINLRISKWRMGVIGQASLLTLYLQILLSAI